MGNIFSNLVSDKELVNTGSGINFGLNKLFIKDIKAEEGEFNGNKTFQLNFEFDVNGSKSLLFLSLLPGDQLYIGGELVRKGDKDFVKATEDFYIQAMGTVVHIYKALGVQEIDIEKVLGEKKPKNIKEWLKAVSSLIPKKYQEIPLDGFFMYQWRIKGNNTRTFLELGPNMKKGHFLSPHVEPVGSWKEVVEGNTHYWKDDEGNKHPIYKSASIMKSACATMQGESNSETQKSSGIFSSEDSDLPFDSNDDDNDDFTFD